VVRVEPLALLGALLGPLVKPAVESLVARILLKPSNIEARLSTVKAYCLYYPLYRGIQRLGAQNLNLIKGLAEGLKGDPAIFARLLPLVGRVGPSRPWVDAEAKESFRRSSSLLYLPEPLFKRLEDVRDEVGKICSLIEREDLEGALKEAEGGFEEEYRKGDIQAFGVEEVVDEALILSVAILKLGRRLDLATAKAAAECYYSVLVLERSLEPFPILLTTILSLFVSSEELLATLEKLKPKLPSGQRLMLNPYVAQSLEAGASSLGFRYEEFKGAFEEAERLLRG
jgi:hypothetical protein